MPLTQCTCLACYTPRSRAEDYDASKLKDKLSGNSSKTGTAEPSSKTTNTSI